jgi:beta-mannosidase
MDQRIDLNGEWEFRRKGRGRGSEAARDTALSEWMRAAVPGTVHTDLLALGLIPDPFYRDNEWKVQWVGKQDWEYRKVFQVDRSFLDLPGVDLVCDGLDTFAAVYINGRDAGEAANMFIRHRFPVKKMLRPGRNEIRIRFSSPIHTAGALEEKHGSLTAARHSLRAYTRKAQYSYGWDWGPCLPTSGIWRGIRLEANSGARIAGIHVRTERLQSGVARLKVVVEVERTGGSLFRYQVDITNGSDLYSSGVRTGKKQFHCYVEIPDPKLWWPNGYGEPNLYDIRVTAFHDDTVMARKASRFGIRTVELRLGDSRGNSRFQFVINGVDVFCKGADWIPGDSFLPRMTGSRYRTLLSMARDAHMNMIRVWGGGIYENPEFYALCDEMGIMVWQDFMFACANYPETAWFIRAVREEAGAVIRRLRNYPSIVIWCGNNENEWIWYRETGDAPDKMKGFRIFHDLLPEICRALDPDRPYWPTTPWSGKDPNCEEEGNRHSWDIWSRWVDFTEAKNDRGRFISEFGFQAPPDPETLENCLQPDERHPQNRIFEHHDKQDEGIERLFRFLAGHQKITTAFRPFIFACQVNQAEALRICIEHWRRRKFETAGTLIWQLNDCWPVISWSLIDYENRPKASYFFARRFFAPVLLSFENREEELYLWLVNDRLTEQRGKLRINVRTFDGRSLHKEKLGAEIVPNGSKAVRVLDKDKYGELKSDRAYVRAVLTLEDEKPVEATHFFYRMKYLDLPASLINARLTEADEGSAVLALSSDKLIRSVFIDLPGWRFSDNFFDLHPGESVEVTCSQLDSKAKAIREIKIISVGNYETHTILWNKPI